MIVNILRFRFKDTVDPATRDKVLARMSETAAVESVSFATVGQDLGDPAEGFTHAFCVGIADVAALRRYFYDPVHLAGDPDILPHFERLYAVRLSDDLDPGLRDEITGLFLEKVRKYPQWGELMAAIPDSPISGS